LDKNVDFKLNDDFDFVENVQISEYKSFLRDCNFKDNALLAQHMDKYLSKIDDLSDDKFMEVFKPLVVELSRKNGMSYENLSSKLLDKKHNMRDNFNRLRKSYCDTDSNDLSKGMR